MRNLTSIIVAMIATHARPELLLDRALPSVKFQTRRPNATIVIEDGETRDLRDQLESGFPGALYLTNRRTPGLAGTINTGLDFLARKHQDPEKVFVAFLDDDDAWDPAHLATVEATIRDGAEVVATPLRRIEHGGNDYWRDPPPEISPQMFMEGNPHIYGSNTVARLDVLLEAGCFNEALPSCNDRDLMIRIAHRPGLKFAGTSGASVLYYACSDRPRLSLPTCAEKRKGLDMFDLIHGPLMPPEVRARHLERANGKFDWRPGSDRDEVDSQPSAAPVPEAEETPPLLVGVIVDDQRVESASRLLDQLADLAADEGFGPVDVLLIENRPESDAPLKEDSPLGDMVARRRPRMRIRLIERALIERLIASGDWKPEGADRRGRLEIADARTALQAFLHHMALERPGSAVWILDDDMRLDILTATGSTPIRRPLQLGRYVRRMLATGADICIGTYNDAPPTPAVGSVRVQLRDFVWNLRRLAMLPADAPVPLEPRRNAKLRAGRFDYHYDLSRTETDRLETPFALDPIDPNETCGEAFERMGDMIPRILAGEAPLRPLVAEPSEMEAFRSNRGLHRGGNTFVFNPEALADVPNLSPTVKGRPARRSDMTWCLMHRRLHGREVISVPVPVRQDRSHLPAPDRLDHMRIAGDIQGYAIFRALSEIEEPENPDRIVEICRTHKEDRLAALRLSFFRIRGLAKEIIEWCSNEAPAHAPRGKLPEQAERLLEMFSPDEFGKIDSATRDMGDADVREFVDGLGERIAKHAELIRDSKEIPLILSEARAEAARAAIEAHAKPKERIRILGQGGEGVVATDGNMIWKLFDQWSPGQEAEAVPVLRNLVDNPAPTKALVQPIAMSRTPVGWLLTMPFEASEPWKGGHGPGIVELIADLHRNGLVFRNFHPKNFRVADGVLRLIDYGGDLKPIDDPTAESVEFVGMCRKAWLCWRFWWRKDLGALLRDSLHNADLPELDGHEGLINAVRERLDILIPEDPTLTRALELHSHADDCGSGSISPDTAPHVHAPPPRALDYGAGKGAQAKRMAAAGWKVVAWDPNPAMTPRLDALAPVGVRRASSADEAVAAGPFDLVVCRRVACLIDDEDLDAALGNIRASLAPNGRALLSLCHPAYAHRIRVSDSVPLSKLCGCGTKRWTKKSPKNGRVLEEFHRSERSLRRRIARAGFRVVGRHEQLRTEFERFETVADLLVLELEPASKPEIALLIKACAMDAEVLEIQVRHILSALEGPSVFRETILALDTRTEGFTREYAPGDLPAAREAARRLRAAGEIDRVVETPGPDRLRALNRLWFGIDVAASHTPAGAATGALLAGFEACGSGLVLHVDIDMMIGRADRTHDPLDEITRVLKSHPQALTTGFPISDTVPFKWTSDKNRVGSRLSLVDLDRVKSILPLPNKVKSNAPELSWHRSMDKIPTQPGSGISLRGGDGREAFCVHPPNKRKRDILDWDEVRGFIERGRVPSAQHGEPEWTCSISDWREPERRERFVFVICGRNVMPERFRRCWNSVLRQNRSDWGAVVIDDASEPWIADEIGNILAPHADRVSFIARRHRVGQLANIARAVRHLCESPDQIIVTLDADDHLIGPGVLDRVDQAYRSGADLTVGSMLRTDKSADYPVCFKKPRLNRGGNVWQHLRTFRKRLFDAIPDESLRLDGEYVELATDWAFMIPMVEAARRPVWIRERLYLHEPGAPRDEKRTADHERVVTRLMERWAAGKTNRNIGIPQRAPALSMLGRQFKIGSRFSPASAIARFARAWLRRAGAWARRLSRHVGRLTEDNRVPNHPETPVRGK